jgi:rhodanese-related sulfurtransferase
VLADAIWYLAGRLYGNRVMKLLCRLSLTPDSCVNETQLRFERWGGSAIVIAKFVPGLAIIAPPLAGALRMNAARFIALSTLGAVLWVGAFLGLGAVLEPQISRWLPRMAEFGGTVVSVIVALLVLYIALKWWQRYRFASLLRMPRASPEELRALLDGALPPVVVDVRSHNARRLEPRVIPGSVHVPLDEVERHAGGLPRDRDIVTYCTCPNEASAAQVAKALKRHGMTRVRPLKGGLDAWLAAGYLVEPIPAPPEAPRIERVA